MKKKEKRGGKRSNAGRTPLPTDEKKKPVTVYLNEKKLRRLSKTNDLEEGKALFKAYLVSYLDSL